MLTMMLVITSTSITRAATFGEDTEEGRFPAGRLNWEDGIVSFVLPILPRSVTSVQIKTQEHDSIPGRMLKGTVVNVATMN